jgi:hypothetical protein
MKPYFLVVQDGAAKTCNIHGPLFDDGPISKEVIAAKKRGRNVNCTADHDSTTRAEAIGAAAARGFTYTDDDLLGG